MYSVHLGDLVDAAHSWVPVVHFKAFALESVGLHAVVVEGAHGVDIGALRELLELLGSGVQFEQLFDAVEVVAHVVVVLIDAKSSVDLILVTKHFFKLFY